MRISDWSSDVCSSDLSIGDAAYGRPILDRALSFDTSITTALKLAYLSFDSSRFSSADVGFPVDFASYARSDRRWRRAQYDYDDLHEQRIWWNEHIKKLAIEMPDGPWTSELRPGANTAHLTIAPDDQGQRCRSTLPQRAPSRGPSDHSRRPIEKPA